MNCLPYFAVHNTFICDEVALKASGEEYRRRLSACLSLKETAPVGGSDGKP
jgi:glutathione-regulated potassium-efflux system ancillary protein KefF